jgi:hypothetical protein
MLVICCRTDANYALAGFGAGAVVLTPIVMIHAFPTLIRFSGVSFSYNFAYALFGELTPLLVSWLAHFDRIGPAHYIAAVTVVGLGGTLMAPKHALSEIDASAHFDKGSSLSHPVKPHHAYLLGAVALTNNGTAPFKFTPGAGAHSYKTVYVETGYGMSSSSNVANLTVGPTPSPVYTDATTMEKLGITDEYFLKMDDAESFLGWCANRNISLILHGHKHVPRYREELVRRTDGNSTLITTVGCGTLWEQKAGHSRTTSLGGTRSLGAGRSRISWTQWMEADSDKNILRPHKRS